MTDKFIGYVRLIEACRTSGCPVCRCLTDDGRRHLDALLYEQVNDPDTRRRLRAAWGLCNWHTWMLRTVATAATGSAILYADLMRVTARRVDRLHDRRPAPLARFFHWLSRLGGAVPTALRLRLVDRCGGRAPCPVCASARDAEARYIDTAIESVDDPQFARAYANCSGLCVPHMVLTIARRPGTPGLRPLLEQTIGKWETLRHRLDDFVREHDYRNTEPISESEAAAGATVLEMVAGGPGVFSNDLHADDVGRRRGR
jgi:hypothetical protein